MYYDQLFKRATLSLCYRFAQKQRTSVIAVQTQPKQLNLDQTILS